MPSLNQYKLARLSAITPAITKVIKLHCKNIK